MPVKTHLDKEKIIHLRGVFGSGEGKVHRADRRAVGYSIGVTAECNTERVRALAHEL